MLRLIRPPRKEPCGPGVLRHSRGSAYRCSLPGLTEFTGSARTGPEPQDNSLSGQSAVHDHRGGGGGIRTHGRVAPTLAFRASQISHSCTPPSASPDERLENSLLSSFHRGGPGTRRSRNYSGASEPPSMARPPMNEAPCPNLLQVKHFRCSRTLLGPSRRTPSETRGKRLRRPSSSRPGCDTSPAR